MVITWHLLLPNVSYFFLLYLLSIYRSQRRDCGPTFYSNLTGAVQLKLDKWNAFFLLPHTYIPWWLKWHRICLKYRRTRFNPWVRKIPWRWEWLCTPVFWPGKFHRGSQQSMGLPRVRQLSTHPRRAAFTIEGKGRLCLAHIIHLLPLNGKWVSTAATVHFTPTK